ncbi:MAG TPA: hypothetical protein VGJ08_02090, partial [Rhizomicrobium sp.]
MGSITSATFRLVGEAVAFGAASTVSITALYDDRASGQSGKIAAVEMSIIERAPSAAGNNRQRQADIYSAGESLFVPISASTIEDVFRNAFEFRVNP